MSKTSTTNSKQNAVAELEPNSSAVNRVEASGKSTTPAPFGVGYKGLIFGTIVLATLAYFCEALGQQRFLYSESSYAQTAREMVQFNSMIVPLLHEHHYYDKPILSYWLVVAAYKLFGISLFSSRIYSVVCAVLTMITVAVATRLTFGRAAAVGSVFCLATAMCFAQFAASSMPDMLLALFDTLALALLYASVKDPGKGDGSELSKDVSKRRRLWFVSGCVAMACGFMAKGPVGLVLPAATFGLFLLCTKQLSALKISNIVLGALAFFAIVLPWHIAVFMIDGWMPIDLLYLTANLQRFAGTNEVYNFNRNPFYMARSFFTGFLPWSLLLPFALIKTLKDIRSKWNSSEDRTADSGAANDEKRATSNGQVTLYLWMWIAVGLLFYSFSKCKWGYYNMPLFPAAAMLVGTYVSYLWTKHENWKNKLALFVGPTVFLSSHVLLIALPMLLGISLQDCFLLPVSGAIGGLISVMFLIKKQLSNSLVAAVTALTMMFCAYSLQIVPAQTKNDTALIYANRMAKEAQKDADLIVHQDLCGQYQLFDPIYFATGRQVKIMDSVFLRKTIEAAGPAYIMVIKDWYDNQSSSMKNRLKVLDTRDFPFVNHPGSQYYRPGPENQTVQVVLLTTCK